MEVYECLRTRRTVRRFKRDPVPEEVVYRLLQAGRWAPSSRNLQPWHFIVIDNPETLAALGSIAGTGSFIAEAPLAIAVAMDSATTDWPELDAGRALQQMELMAWSEGLGTCFVTVRPQDQNRRIRELLGIPERLELITVLPFGYRAEGFKSRGAPRKPMSEIAHRGRFGVSYSA